MKGSTAYPGRFESKFLVPQHQAVFVAEWLAHVCVPDPRFPSNVVNSLYYDTPRLDLCAAKESSDFLKAKIRVRWYDDTHNIVPPVFLEAKMKEGTQVHKARLELEDDGLSLASLDAGDEDLLGLQAKAQALVPFPLGLLRPVCVVTYRRARFVDPRTGWRVSLDTEIRVPLANTRAYPFTEEAAFDYTVLELKGHGSRPILPDHLIPHPDIKILSETFSKYYSGVESLKLAGVPL